MNRELYTYEEAAEWLRLAPSTMKRLCDERRIGYIVKEYRRGYGRYRRRKRFIPHSALLEFMARRACCRHMLPRLTKKEAMLLSA
jgi:Helix-turn-helix domain